MIGKLIREHRQRLGLTQKQLAAELGVVYLTINRWENGHVTPSPMAMKLLEQKFNEMDEPSPALAQEKELNEMKSRLITTISHEYRTPLTTILLSAELLENYRYKWDDAKQLKYFQRIQSSVWHMTALVNDVLFLNQAELTKLSCHPAPLNLVAFFKELIDEQQATIGNKHRLNFTHMGEKSQFLGDAKLLRQILTNLIDNAIKYSPSGGTVSLFLTLEETQVILSCLDEGIGIPVEDQQDLFKFFSRASNVGTIGGTGLGLAIVKKCVDLYRGQITVDSVVGEGTKFTVTLPLKHCC